MRLELEFYGPLQDRMGGAKTRIELDTAPTTQAALISALAEQIDGGDALSNPHLRLAVNDAIAAPDSPLTLNDGDRIAFLSPFSGG